jgi:hypothetical protein
MYQSTLQCSPLARSTREANQSPAHIARRGRLTIARRRFARSWASKRGSPVGSDRAAARSLTSQRQFRRQAPTGQSPRSWVAGLLHALCAPMLTPFRGLPDPQRAALSTTFGLATGPQPERFMVGLAVLRLLADTAEEEPAVHRRRSAAGRLGLPGSMPLVSRIGSKFAGPSTTKRPHFRGLADRDARDGWLRTGALDRPGHRHRTWGRAAGAGCFRRAA